jgi:hypothetical protein
MHAFPFTFNLVQNGMDKAGTIKRVPDPDPALSTRSCIPGKARDALGIGKGEVLVFAQRNLW